MTRFIFVTTIILLTSRNHSQCDEHVYCEDGSQCPAHNSCCKTSRGYSCCPFSDGVCCGDDFHCCSSRSKCDLNRKICLDEIGHERLLTEMAPTSLIYKKGWNELYYNCKDDLKSLKDDLFDLFVIFMNSSSSENSHLNEYFRKLKKDGKITSSDCIKFIKEVFG